MKKGTGIITNVKTEVWRSNDTIQIFPYDPALDYKNVTIKKDAENNFVAASISDPTGKTTAVFVEPGDRVWCRTRQSDYLYLMNDEEYTKFKDSGMYDLTKDKPGTGTGGNEN